MNLRFSTTVIYVVFTHIMESLSSPHLSLHLKDYDKTVVFEIYI
jgi:hypothetical protein